MLVKIIVYFEISSMSWCSLMNFFQYISIYSAYHNFNRNIYFLFKVINDALYLTNKCSILNYNLAIGGTKHLFNYLKKCIYDKMPNVIFSLKDTKQCDLTNHFFLFLFF